MKRKQSRSEEKRKEFGGGMMAGDDGRRRQCHRLNDMVSTWSHQIRCVNVAQVLATQHVAAHTDTHRAGVPR